MEKQYLKITTKNEDIDRILNEWLEWDRGEQGLKKIETLAQNHQYDELKKLFSSPRLTFGTAGLRGPMQPGPGGMNELIILQTAQGLLRYSEESLGDQLFKRGVVIGYDGRYNSKRFAEITARIFQNAEVPVGLFTDYVPTPLIPYTVMSEKYAIGIMVTASHNPKDDNGYKVYWENSCQITPPHDKNIQKHILENLKPWPKSWDITVLPKSVHKDPSVLFDNYCKSLSKLIPDNLMSLNSKSSLEFVYSPMHGVGYKYIQKAFEQANLRPVIAVEEQAHPDPDFPTVKFPNPEENKALDLAIELANKKGKTIVLANDPDADRLACAEKLGNGEWHIFTGNELGALLGWWSLEVHKLLNPNLNLDSVYMLSSAVSSKILKTMAEHHGFHFIETLTGFKWMGNEAIKLIANKKHVLFAFEEAIGFMWGTLVLDKDGISAATMLATLACFLYDEKKLTLHEQINRIYNQYGYHMTINSYYICHEQDTINSIFARLRNFPGSKRSDKYPHEILNGKYEISRIQDLTTCYDSLLKQPNLPCSKSSQIITFFFNNGFSVTLRTSGTEPKLKYYSEMCAKPEMKDLVTLKQTVKEMIEAVCQEFLQPEENRLISREK
ncbi:phosphoglucomutase-2 [Ctenocephalides felis]|uniref:phosphoglucomutase-2 n=1 Tax=Ctenocephalides felis TaxID=7515 RepID=UPI000E6E4124|nr:phosphoglucomutase-2 [Ctenocephalides felis]